MRGKQRSWKWLIGTGLGVTAFLAWAALASGALSQHTKSVTIAPKTDGSATASCPSGSEAVSGGFAAPGFDPNFNQASNIPFSSRRSGNGWGVDAKNFGQAAGTESSFVYCDKSKPNLASVSTTTKVAASQNGTATAQCPSGSEAVSGGWQSPPKVTGDEAFFAFTSERKGDRKWKVTAFNDDNNNAHKLRAFAYCDKSEPGLVERSKSTKVALMVSTTLNVKCPNGSQAVSGGFESSPVDQPFDDAFTTTSRRATASTWRTSAYGNGTSTTKRPITAFAYCKK